MQKIRTLHSGSLLDYYDFCVDHRQWQNAFHLYYQCRYNFNLELINENNTILYQSDYETK